VWLFARTGSERFDANTGALQEKFGPATRLLGVSSDGAFALRFAKAGGFEVGALGARAALAVPGQLAAFVAGDEVLVVEGPQGTGPLSLKRVDPRTQQVTASVTTLAVEGVPFDLSVSPAGTSVLVGIDPGFVTVDVASLGSTLTKERLRGFAGFASEAVCVAVNEDGALETVSRPRRQ
jgi:hypothetical protein